MGLVLTLKPGESALIGKDIYIVNNSKRKSSIRIIAPKEVPISRVGILLPTEGK